jgi:hypothetical protein
MVGDVSFFERDVNHRIDWQDSFALVWSEYEARRSPEGAVIYSGTNCFHLR